MEISFDKSIGANAPVLYRDLVEYQVNFAEDGRHGCLGHIVTGVGDDNSLRFLPTTTHPLTAAEMHTIVSKMQIQEELRKLAGLWGYPTP